MTKDNFQSIEKLYHYTSFESALKIIESQTLLFNPLKRMNDINELYRPLYFNQNYSKENWDKMKEMIYSHQQISLSRDIGVKKGFDIPAMWGHYSDKGRGVCLVFSKEKLLNTLSEEHIKGSVRYLNINKFDPDIVASPTIERTKRFSKREYRDYFFKKTKDWSYEQEFRILLRSDSCERVKLCFQDALIGVIAHRADDVKENEKYWNSIYCSILKKYCDNIYVYESWGKERHLQKEDGKCVWLSYDPSRYSLALD